MSVPLFYRGGKIENKDWKNWISKYLFTRLGS